MYFEGIEGLNIRDFINSRYKIYAHKDGERYESLENHIALCEKYFYKILKEKNIDDILESFEMKFLFGSSKEAIDVFREMLLGVILLHDMGKVNACYQKNRLGNKLQDVDISNDNNSHHSMLSVIIYIDYYFPKIRHFKGRQLETLLDFMILNAYVISRHHGGLTSIDNFKDSFKEDREGADLIVKQRNLFEKIYLREIKLTITNINNIFKKTDKYKDALNEEERIYRYIYERLMFSILVACDFYATTEFMNDIEINDLGSINEIDEFYNIYKESSIYKSIREYENNNYGKIDDFSKVSNINVLRDELFLDAEKSILNNLDKDIFYLEAPTGSGKSNIATNLSFKLLELDKRKNKIFYVYPFNTLVEQNVNNLQKIFGNTEVFDKIAVINSVYPVKQDKRIKGYDEDDIKYYQKALLNRQFLNYPMILTTHVTIFKYLFGVNKEDVFPLHQLVNSIIVLDEIQSYKNLIWGEIIRFLGAYGKILNVKIIVMSATLPNLNNLVKNTSETTRLIENRHKYFSNSIFKDRVSVDFTLLQSKDIKKHLYEHVKITSNNYNKILVEFIRKSSAYSFYKELFDNKEDESLVLLMTGDDNSFERERILNLVKESEKVILVATQVIEAGVDIDMDIGYKDISILDSEEQFLGRINRSCNKRKSVVYFFNLDEASSIYKEDKRTDKDLTLNNESMRDILANKDFNNFYTMVMKRLRDLTSGYNTLNIDEFFKNSVGNLDFNEVSKRMELISDENTDINVYLSSTIRKKDGSELCGERIWNEYKNILGDKNMEYSKQRVLLSEVRAKMNNFIYRISWNSDFTYNDRVGDLYFIENGDNYFEDGKLDREKFIKGIGDFI